MKPIKLEYLFSKNDKIGSKLIRWGTKHLSDIPKDRVPSHVALLINERWVLESTLEKGVSVDTWKNWLQRNKVTGRYECFQERDYRAIKAGFKVMKGKSYDWLGVLYFSWRILLDILRLAKIPKDNPWESDDRFFCSEVVADLLELGDAGMTSPVQIMKKCEDLGLSSKV